MKLARAATFLSAALWTAGMSHGADVNPDLSTAAQRATLQKTLESCTACHGVNGRRIAHLSQPGSADRTVY
jgi:mono/diheme cytochrome c family protein